MTDCPYCDQFFTSDAGRLETHLLWKHPTRADMFEVRESIPALAADVQAAWATCDVLRARMLLGHLHQALLLAMTYLDDDLNDEVTV